MGDFTKETSAEGPRQHRRARGGSDDDVHLVLAGPVDLVDPSSLLTLCGMKVLQVYNDDQDLTCDPCKERAEQVNDEDG